LPRADTTLGSITVEGLGVWAFVLAIEIVLLWYLFHPTKNVSHRRAWGALGGFVLIGIAVFLGLQIWGVPGGNPWDQFPRAR
jgi:hypothetical protein